LPLFLPGVFKSPKILIFACALAKKQLFPYKMICAVDLRVFCWMSWNFLNIVQM